jgi:hypothetical protein
VQLERLGRLLLRAAPFFNAPVAAMAASPRFGGLINGNIAMLTYTGRRTGRKFSIPVGYRRDGDEITVGVSMPEAKTWWRNFLGDGAPLVLRLDGIERAGHAVAHRDDKGNVSVAVRLTD